MNRTIIILKLLYSFKILDIKDLTILSGSKDESVIRKKVNKMIADGFIEGSYYGNKKVYVLKNKGAEYIERNGSTLYTPKGMSTQHLLDIADVACWLYLTKNLSPADFITDRLMYKYKLKHEPDLIVSQTAYEIELNVKNKVRLHENIKNNNLNFDSQVWVLPKRLQRTKKEIEETIKNIGGTTEIVTIEEINKFLKMVDLSDNKFRPFRTVNTYKKPEKKNKWEDLQ